MHSSGYLIEQLKRISSTQKHENHVAVLEKCLLEEREKVIVSKEEVVIEDPDQTLWEFLDFEKNS
jgi:hypothetical protein